MTDITNTTQPPRRWGRLLVRVLLWIVGIIILLVLIIWLIGVHSDWKQFQRDREGYLGIKLGASMDEATYVFGTPTYVLGPPEKDTGLPDPENGGEWQQVLTVDGSDPKNKIPDGKTVKDYLDWQTKLDGYSANISFDPKTKKVIRITCELSGPNDSASCPWLYGVSQYDDEDRLVDKLGPAKWHQYSGPSKGLKWDGIGLEIQLMQKKPYMITKNADSSAGFGWFFKHEVL